jgi:hypothetical protein
MIRKICVAVFLVLVTAVGAVIVGPPGAALASADAYVNE